MLTSALLVALVMYIAKFADHTLGQPLIERPLICGAMVGFVLGDFQQGIIIGATLELIFLGTITIGGSVPADWRWARCWLLRLPYLPARSLRWLSRSRCPSACWRYSSTKC